MEAYERIDRKSIDIAKITPVSFWDNLYGRFLSFCLKISGVLGIKAINVRSM